MSHEAWLAIWLDSHTAVAIETQSTFEYVQNVVVRALTPNANAYAAIVEECFPLEALTDRRVFFDARDDKAKLKRNVAAMTESCARFIAPGAIDIIATSQFNFS